MVGSSLLPTGQVLARVGPPKSTYYASGPATRPAVSERLSVPFVHYYNHHRYYEGVGNVTPYELYTGKRQEILERRKEVKRKTLEARRKYNGIVREQELAPPGVH